jgi:hypothetical protein
MNCVEQGYTININEFRILASLVGEEGVLGISCNADSATDLVAAWQTAGPGLEAKDYVFDAFDGMAVADNKLIRYIEICVKPYFFAATRSITTDRDISCCYYIANFSVVKLEPDWNNSNLYYLTPLHNLDAFFVELLTSMKFGKNSRHTDARGFVLLQPSVYEPLRANVIAYYENDKINRVESTNGHINSYKCSLEKYMSDIESIINTISEARGMTG